MKHESDRHIGDIIKERQNIILKGADAATAKGFTQVPNFLLKSKKLSSGDKMAFAMLLSYAWQNDFCFPGQNRLAQDMGAGKRSVIRFMAELEKAGYIAVTRRGLGQTNLYKLFQTIIRPNKTERGRA